MPSSKHVPVPGIVAPQPDFGGFNVVGIYARWALDCIVEAATAIAHDYRTRYRQYRAAPAAIADVLANMKSRVGYDPAWPNAAQRAAINSPLVGPSDRAEAALLAQQCLGDVYDGRLALDVELAAAARQPFRRLDRRPRLKAVQQRVGVRSGTNGAMNGGRHCPDDGICDVFLYQQRRDIQ